MLPTAPVAAESTSGVSQASQVHRSLVVFASGRRVYCPDGELSIVLVDDSEIADLNERYLNRKGPTNVIAFPMREGSFTNVNPNLLGDVVISMDTCYQEGQSAKMDFLKRFNQLLIHGILHLLGYDHIHSEKQAREMELKSQELMEELERLNISI